ncbi:MAG: UDP-2,4-diacetamido-2,4,6-trideoxy-beta-L-altropyranose hydrolase [Lachnospiraceae bacterium]
MGDDSIIYIRTDGNQEIATGHLVRCISIARALEKLGRRIYFLVADQESQNLLERFGISRNLIIILKNACYFNMDSELSALSSLLFPLSGKPVLLLDSYFITPKYLNTVKEAAYVAYMDDLRKWDYDVDIIINYDVISPSELSEYRSFYSSAKSTLLGTDYTPLRSQFSDCTPIFRKKVQHILITSGGSDPEQFCLKLVKLLIPKLPKGIQLHVVIGSLFSAEEKQALSALSKEWKTLLLYEGLTDLSSLMKQCDLAVSSAGTTLYELCALGIPAVSFTMADNQKASASAFHRAGILPYAGDIRQGDCENTTEKIASFFIEMCSEAANQKRKAQQKAMHQMIDGKGAMRIANALCKLQTP